MREVPRGRAIGVNRDAPLHFCAAHAFHVPPEPSYWKHTTASALWLSRTQAPVPFKHA